MNVYHLTHQPHAVGSSRKIHHAVALGTARHFGGIFARRALYQNTLHSAQAAVANALHVGLNGGLQMVQALELQIVRGLVVQIGRGCAGAWAEYKAEAGVVAHIVDEFHHLAKVFFGFPGKAHNEVAAHGHVRPNGAQFANGAFVFHRGVATLHGH